MKIAYFAESIPPMTDGVSRTMGRMFSTLEMLGIDYRVYAPVAPDPGTDLHLRVKVLPSVPFSLYSYYRISLPQRKDLAKDLDAFAPDLIHCTTPTPSAWEALRYGRRKTIPCVASYHTHFVDYFKYYGVGVLEGLGWKYLRWFYNQFRAVFVPARSVMGDLSERGFTRLRHWPRGVDLDRFSPFHRSETLRRITAPDGEPILLYVGRLVKEKNLDLLVSTEEVLRLRGRRFRLVLVGDGPMAGELKMRIPWAHFTGTLQGTELSRWYASADVFVFPSTTETFGNVVQEAFASALPVVGVRAGGVLDLVRPEVNGLLAEPSRPLDFADQVDRMLVDRALRKRMGRTARLESKALEWDVINNRLVEEYRMVVEQERIRRRYHVAA
jgi:glycosyltransferase involved in cell wall biosynthesis